MGKFLDRRVFFRTRPRVAWAPFVIALSMGLACQTTPPPREVQDLEVGMRPEEVSALLGEPDWAQRMPTPDAGASASYEDVYAAPEAETWVYLDDFVRRRDVAFFSLFSVALLGMPLIVEGLSSFDDETLPYWATRRTSWLHFEADQLASWSFDYVSGGFGENRSTPGAEMIYDPEIEAYRVAACRPEARDDEPHTEHCAHYYAESAFYRYDEDGWCTSLGALGPWTPIGVESLPYELWHHEMTAAQPILDACEESIESIEAETRIEIAALEKAGKEAIEQVESDPQADPEQRTLAIRKVKARTHAKMAGLMAASEAAIEAAWKDANAEITAMQQLAALALKAKGPTNTAKIEAIREARQESILEREKIAIRAAKGEAAAKIAEIQMLEKEAIAKARTESNALRREASIKAAKADARAKVTATRHAETTAIDAVKQDTKALMTSVKSPQSTWANDGAGYGGGTGIGGFGTSPGGFGGFDTGGGAGSSGGFHGGGVPSVKGGGGKTKPSK
jgi:uncharacterized membrane protein YgcG